MKFKSEQTSQKLRGGYYTPQNIADYTTKWVLGCEPKSILEPSCGDGVFFQSLYNNKCNSDININGFELFDTEAQKSNDLCQQLKFNNTVIKEGDFLEWANPKIVENKTEGMKANFIIFCSSLVSPNSSISEIVLLSKYIFLFLSIIPLILSFISVKSVICIPLLMVKIKSYIIKIINFI